jgi:hypothetical protein
LTWLPSDKLRSRLPGDDHHVVFVARFEKGKSSSHPLVQRFAALEAGSIAMAAAASDLEKFGAHQPVRIDSHRTHYGQIV